ncbi:MAG: exodeoxyribonuclease III [Phycisphaerales bacterium]
MATLTVASWNVNGMRAAIRKGIDARLASIRPDVLLLQETRARAEQLPEGWASPEGWHVHWNPAERAGYSGTAVWSRHAFRLGEIATPDDRDHEGRLVLSELSHPWRSRKALLRVASVYLPSGSSSESRQAEKDRWLAHFGDAVSWLSKSSVPTILGGDFNIAHTERDIYHWRSNQGTSGFLPHEREWMGGFIGSGWHDLVREEFGDRDGPYSWWSNRGNARSLDRGWRIDYLFANRAARGLVDRVWIDRESGLAISDHAPVCARVSVAV